MSTVGERELRTQLRVVEFFRDALGYAYLGHWKNRPDNGNVERARLGDWRLERQGHSGRVVDRALFALGKAAALGGSKTLYDANREVYGLLRYGVKVAAGGRREHGHRMAHRLDQPRRQRLRYRRRSGRSLARTPSGPTASPWGCWS